MKTKSQIKYARTRLAERLKTPGLSDCQKALVCGMLNALVWVAGGYASSMDRMLSDEPMEAGKDPAAALERLKRLEAPDG